MKNRTSILTPANFYPTMLAADSAIGQVVQRYNIIRAKLENYFIPSNNIDGYESAKKKQDVNAASKYGTKLGE